ncbi:MAG: hypothetical protein GWP63_01840 [Haliea sp.]|jgi:nitrate/TMAO reductase-like tetraheme cytochrome c subunit|nr:hypothetical protein [Haliea sp.]
MNRIQGAVTALALVASVGFSASTMAETAAEEGQRLFREHCRNCHRLERMDFEAQSRAVRRYHRGMKSRGKTCIDCHEGIAHPESG